MNRERTESMPRKIIGWTTLVVMIIALWYFVLPPRFGGYTTLLTTHGVSMQPVLYDGDLAILRKEKTYTVGNVVEYHSSALNAPILHRIVAVSPDGTYSTKGDNNDFVDLDQPSNKQITGKMVHRYSGLGKKIGWIKSLPARIIGAALVGFAIYSALAGKDKQKRRQRSGRRAPNVAASRQSRSFGFSGLSGMFGMGATTDSPNTTQSPEPTASDSGTGDASPRSGLGSKVPKFASGSNALRGIFAIITVVSLLTAFASYSHPTKSKSDGTVIYNITGALNYSGSATGGDLVYQNGQVQTGDTIYLAMVNNVFMTFRYNLTSFGEHYKGGGTIAMNAVLSGESGWTHTVVLTAPTPFTGSSATATANVDLRQINALFQQIVRATNVPSSSYQLKVEPQIVLDGSLSGQKINQTFAPSAVFGVTNNLMKPSQGGDTSDNTTESTSTPLGPVGLGAKKSVLDGLKTSTTGQVTIPSGSPQALEAQGVKLGIETLRIFSTIGLIVGILGLIAVTLASRTRKEDLPQAERLEHDLRHYQSLMVPVSGWDQVRGGSMIIDLPTIDDLARVAETHSSLILQEKSADGNDVFLVNHRHLTYRYQYQPLKQAEQRFGVRPESDMTDTSSESEA